MATALDQQSTTISTSFSLLSLLQPPLLALVASHLEVNTLLCFQRCSSTHYRLRTNGAYMSVAWRFAELRPSLTENVAGWTLPYTQCIRSIDLKHRIPVAVWHAALPVYRAVLAKADKADEWRQRLQELLEQPQHTKWVTATPNRDGCLRAVRDESGERYAVVERVEVLSDISRGDVWDALPHGRKVDVRCRYLFQACPYLQHIHIAIYNFNSLPPRHESTFALLPRLRSLTLDQLNSSYGDGTSRFDWQTLLYRLPSLTSLSCIDIDGLNIYALLLIASHSTLEHLHIDGFTSDFMWQGNSVVFPIDADEDEKRLEVCLTHDTRQEAMAAQTEADDAAFLKQLSTDRSLDCSEQLSRQRRKERTFELQMRTALTRTQPTQRSCEVRLALADWLSRRLRRDRLFTDDGTSTPGHPMSQLLRYRMLLVLLRSTLRQQLSEVALETEAAPPAE